MKHFALWPAGLLLAITPGCMTATLDLRNIEEPVLLTGDPFVGGAPDGMTGNTVGEYEGEVGKSVTATAYAATVDTAVNNAQAVAFEKIGGTRRVITNVSLDIDAWGSNALYAFGEAVIIKAAGIVKEYLR